LKLTLEWELFDMKTRLARKEHVHHCLTHEYAIIPID
jgi:hypothetical protein